MGKETKEKIKLDYKKFTLEDICKFFVDYKTKAEGREFVNKFYEDKPARTTLVNVLDAEGKAKTYINKKGKTCIKKKRIAVDDEKKQVYNILKAKSEFYKKFKDEIEFINVPESAKKSTEDKVKKALSLLDE